MESCNALAENEQAMEIFVLSPEILKKLGINLFSDVSTEAGEPTIYSHKNTKNEDTNIKSAQNLGHSPNEVFNLISNSIENTIPVQETSMLQHEEKKNVLLDDFAPSSIASINENELFNHKKITEMKSAKECFATTKTENAFIEHKNHAKSLSKRKFTSTPNFQINKHTPKCLRKKKNQIIDQGLSNEDDLNQQTVESHTHFDKVYLEIGSCAIGNSENKSTEYSCNKFQSQSLSSQKSHLPPSAVPISIPSGNLATPIYTVLSHNLNECNVEVQIPQEKEVTNPDQRQEILVNHRDRNKSENEHGLNIQGVKGTCESDILPYEKSLELNNEFSNQELLNVFSVYSHETPCNILDSVNTCDTYGEYIQYSDIYSIDNENLDNESSEQLEKKLRAVLAPQSRHFSIIPNIDNQIKLPNIDVLKKSIANRHDKSIDVSMGNCNEEPKMLNESSLCTNALNASAVDKTVNTKLVLKTDKTGLDIRNYSEPITSTLKKFDDPGIGEDIKVDCSYQSLNDISSSFLKKFLKLATFEKQVCIDKTDSLGYTNSSIKDNETIKKSSKLPNKDIASHDSLSPNSREDPIFDKVSNKKDYGCLITKNEILQSTPNVITKTTSNRDSETIKKSSKLPNKDTASYDSLLPNNREDLILDLVSNKEDFCYLIKKNETLQSNPNVITKTTSDINSLEYRNSHPIDITQKPDIEPLITETISMDKTIKNIKLKKIHKLSWQKYKVLINDIKQQSIKNFGCHMKYIPDTENIIVYNNEKRRYFNGNRQNYWEKTLNMNALPGQTTLPPTLKSHTWDVTIGSLSYNDTSFYDLYHKNYPISGNLMLVNKTYPSKKSMLPCLQDSICIADTTLFQCSEDQPLMVYKSPTFKHVCTFKVCPLRSSYFEHKQKKKLMSPLIKYNKSYRRIDGVTTEPYIQHERNRDHIVRTKLSFSNKSDTLKCGVCDKICYPREWLLHSANEHNYIAWIDGFRPIDLSNFEDILGHLSEILKFIDTLHCNLCGAEFVQGHEFWNHVLNCRYEVLDYHEKLSLKNDYIVHDKNINEIRSSPNIKGKCRADNAESDEWPRAYLLTNKLQDITNKKNNNNDTYSLNNQNILAADKRKEISGSKEKLIEERKSNSPQNERSRIQHDVFETGVAVNKCITQQNSIENVSVCNTKSTKTYCRKRNAQFKKISEAPTKQILKSEVKTGDTYICGACCENISVYDWIAHIGKEHKYLSWKKGLETLDVTDPAHVRSHLRSLLKDYQALRCYLCGTLFYQVLKFQTHIEKCDGSKTALERDLGFESDSEARSSCEESESQVTWNQKFNEVPAYSQLLEDISHYHEKADDSSSEASIQSKLLNLEITNNKVMGNDKKPKKRGRKRKNSSTDPDDAPLSRVKRNQTLKEVECGVCHSDIQIKDWFKHIHQNHAYLAWRAKEPAIDFNDETQKLKHLETVIASTLVLKCNICSTESDTVAEYSKHVSECKPVRLEKPKSKRGRKKRNQEIIEVTVELEPGEKVKCGVCGQSTPTKQWTKHNMEEHFNLAWIDGTTPLDPSDVKFIEKRLKEYKGVKRHLVCDKCGLSRVSCMGFYAHIITCQKTEAEVEALKVPCDECNEGQLPIYMQQHKYYHKLKRQQAEEKANSFKRESLESSVNDELEELNTENQGRRKAAVKAQACLDKIKVEVEIEPTMIKVANDDDYEEDNYEMERRSSDEEEIALDDMLPEEDSLSPAKRVRPPKAKEGSYIDNTPKCPFETSNPARFILNCMKEFCDTNFTEEDLFPHLKCNMFTPLPAEEWLRYLPPLKESCSIAFERGQNWTKLERFGCHRSKTDVWCVFAGAPVACVSWAPPTCRLSDAPDDSLLMVSTHPTTTVVGLHASDTYAHPALLQLWNFKHFQSKPQFVLGLAHDFGTVWGMDWCPSGCRDSARLGLLAAACSNGAVYILPVCQPNCLPKREIPLFKTKPVLELRLTSGLDRKTPQATSVAWNKKKGHSLILVGYSDGSIGMYNLNTNSPLLVSIVKGSTVLYPFTDVQLLEAPITGVCFSGEGGGEGWAAWCGSVVGGVGWRGHSSPAPLQSARQPVAPPAPVPHHPVVLLPLDAPFLHGTMDMWWGGGTAVGGGPRLAAGRLMSACWVRARLATLTRSALLLAHAHPVLPHHEGARMKCKFLMLPKKSKPKDNLLLTIEPNTYEEAIEKYGVCLVLNERRGATEQTVPERYQLAEMTCLQFCPASKHCHRLAVAGNAGFLFIFNVT